MFAGVRIRTLWVLAVVGALVLGCDPQAHTVYQAARQEVFTTATCEAVDVSHVPASDVPEYREDVYVAEGCGMRWRMACGSKYVRHCKRHSSTCTTKLEWDCSDIQSEDHPSDDELRSRLTRPDDESSFLGS
jgi:hypothetical protein